MFELLDNNQVLMIEFIGDYVQKTAFCMFGEQQALFESGKITEEVKNQIDALKPEV